MTPSDFRAWLEALADAEAVVPAVQVLARLPEGEEQEAQPAESSPIEMTWREKLWVVPSETRLGAHEVCEALGRSSSWLYRHTSAKALSKSDVAPIPHRKLEGELTFLVGELRTWLRETEESVHEVAMTATTEERALRVVGGAS